MKLPKVLSIIFSLILVVAMVQPASAQLGGSEKSSFTVQNISDSTATVAVEFVAADGTKYTPATLVPPSVKNPFTLAAGKSQEIYVPNISSSELPPGRYSVVISSDQQIVASANVLGEGSINFNGSYNGLAAGAKTFYLPSFLYNYYGWYSMVTVQNVGSSSTNVTVTISCASGAVGTYTKTGLAASAGVTFDSKTTLPSGFPGTSTKCDGSAVVTSTASDVIAVDNQSVPTGGFTQSYTGVTGGGNTLYAPVLWVNYFNWDSSVNVLKIAPGSTTVTVTYSDGATPSTYLLTDATPGHLFYMPTTHPVAQGVKALFSATITSSNSAVPIVGVINAGTRGTGQAQTFNSVTEGASTIVAPGLFKYYYGWISSVTCQNVSTTPTAINISYEGYAPNAYDSKVLNQNQAVEFAVFSETFLGGGVGSRWNGGAILTAKALGAKIACVISHNNATQMRSTQGDWSTSVNAFSK